MPSTVTPADHDVALRDGSTVLVRPVRAADRDGLTALIGGLSRQSTYFRFFRVPRSPDLEVARLLAADGRRDLALVAETGGRLVGVGSFTRDLHSGARTEIAFAVADDVQGHGIGTQLLGELATS